MDQLTFSRLSGTDQARLRNSGKIAQALENAWAAKVTAAAQSFIPQIIKSLEESRPLPDLDFGPLMAEHFFEVSIRSMRYALSESEQFSYLPRGAGRLAFPKPWIPKSLADLMRTYDAYRKGAYKPARALVDAKDIQKAYLEKVRSVWERHSADFRKGDTATQALVVEQIKKAAETTASRARNIVRTETTTYYNQARKTVYDESQDITHYLFIAIRDATTSPWCTPLTINGKRGRSGLVYAKSDPLCAKECPSCHPGCRSEFLPLNRLNPAHLRFIQDEKIQRRNHECYPLLKGWRAA